MKLDLTRRLVLPVIVGVSVGGCTPDPASPAPALPVEALAVPAAAGSVGPNLAASPDGTLVLSWIEPSAERHALRYAVFGDGGWSEPRTVTAGADWFVNWADFPSVTPVSADLWAAHWLVRQPAGGYAYDVLVALSTDGGRTWPEPVTPHRDGTPTEHGFVTLFPRPAGVGLVWLDGRRMHAAPSTDRITNGMTLRAATVTREASIVEEALVDDLTCDCCQTDAVPTAEGVVAVYRDRTEGEVRDIYAARLTRDGWQPGRRVADDGWIIPGCPVNGPVIAADGARLAVTWFTAAHDRPRVRLARSRDAGASWSAAIDVVAGETAGHAGLAWLPDESVAVSWVCTVPGGGAGVCVRAVPAGGEPGPVRVLGGSGRVPALSVPQLARHGDSLVAVWTEETGGQTRIASAALPVAALP